MLVSIILPVYNSESHLRRCIDSILVQTFSEWELIIIDDGSTDKSGSICDEYANKDNRIKVYHSVNGGVSKARNRGLDSAHGEWLTFCDSDDEMLPTALACYVSNMLPDVDLIRGGFERIKAGYIDTISTTSCVIDNKEQVICKCSDTRYEAYLWNSCFRRSAIKNVRFREDISWCEDHLFTFSIIRNVHKVAFTSDIVYRYYASAVTNGTSFGSNLSSRYINPQMILTGALAEMDIKMSCLNEHSIVCLELINKEFEYKVRLAIRYAIIGSHYLQALRISNKYFKNNFIQLLKDICYLKLFPFLFLNKNKQSTIHK